ncbi:MAG: ABC transporter substrate-binding protein [Clostridia bacterium]|nr:ABC transporter substrate-binding protein [Clostridia bacterium]
MKKLFALVLALVMLASLGSALADDKTTVIFWYSLSGTNAEAILEIVNRYNESQDKVFVQAEYEGEYDDAINKLKAAAIGELPCDIVHSYEIGTRFILDSGKITPVQEFIDKDGWDTSVIEPNLLAYYTVDGKINSMPFNCSTPLLYYNKTAFEEAGITEVPTTVDGILEIAAKLSLDKNGKHGDEEGFDKDNIERYGFVFSNYGWFFEQWTGKMGREYVNNGNGRESYATQVQFGENGAALDIFKMWEKIAACPYTTYIDRGGTSNARAAFCSGNTAIFLASTANLAGVLSNVGDAFEVGTAFFPYVNAEDAGGVSTGGGTLWIVTHEQERMEAAFDFIKFCVNPENQAYWSSITGYFPINVNSAETDTFKTNLEKYPQFQVALDQLHASGPAYVGSLLSVFPEVRQYVEEVTEKVYNGVYTAEQGVEELVKLANDTIEEYNLVNYD